MSEEATVQEVGGYFLVTYGGWQVTVAPDATVRLPMLVRCQDIDVFCEAMQAAKPVAEQIAAANAEAAADVDLTGRVARMRALENGMVRRMPANAEGEADAGE